MKFLTVCNLTMAALNAFGCVYQIYKGNILMSGVNAGLLVFTAGLFLISLSEWRYERDSNRARQEKD